MDELYLEGRVKDNKILLTATSYVTLFIVQYCERRDYMITLVETGNAAQHISVPVATVQTAYEYKTADCVPTVIQQCSLPALRPTSGCRVLSGLCGVLRNIIQTSANQESRSILRQLLGHKQICLKACAEVSAWTRFCEIEMPAMVDQLLSQTSSSESCTIPMEMIKLENQFKLPVVVSNIGKRRRQAQNVRKQDSRLASQLSEVQLDKPATLRQGRIQESDPSVRERSADCDVLSHTFVEGIDLTLADLVLYPLVACVMQYWDKHLPALEQHLPLTCAWYRKVGEKSGVIEAIPPTLMAEESSRTMRVSLPPADLANISIREVKRKKFKASGMDISIAMEKFEFLSDKLNSGLSQALELDLQLPWEQYPEAVHPKDGDLPQDRLTRKCQQLQNLAVAIVNIAKSGQTIVDFCSGGGHLGILLGYLLPYCKIILAENKEESIARAEKRISKLDLKNITIYQCNLDYFQGSFDIGTCLHACGVATDLVLQTCLDNQASFVICPCCYGSIQDTHTMTYPRSQTVLAAGISYKEYLCVGHGADQTQVTAPSALRGKQCMEYIDKDRAALALELGYKVTLATLQPPECSPKNNLIVGAKS